MRLDAKAGVLVALVGWVYAPAFWWMADRWWASDSYYSHGLLIPIVSAALVWRRRHELAALTLSPSPAGLRLIGVAIAMQLLSALWRIYFLSAFSLLTLLAGMVLAVGGRPLWRQVWFPILFLVFMIPMPLALIAQVSLQLKFLAASVSREAIGFFGIPSEQDGSTLYLPHGVVLVEDVCSGLRSLIALLALGVLFTYLTKTVWWKRAALLTATVPIALGANIFRITTVCLVSEVYGYEFASGAFHDAMGFIAFGVAYGLFALLATAMRTGKEGVS